MNISESIWLALDSVRMNKLRAFLTLLSIAIGVFAIIGAGGLVSSIDNAITGEINKAGATSFTIGRMPLIQTGNRHWRKYSKRKPISYSQFKKLKKTLAGVKFVTANSFNQGVRVKSKYYETDPDVLMVGGDENFIESTNYTIAKGRNLSSEDISLNKNVALIGNDVLKKAFPGINPVGQKIKIKNHHFIVVGVLAEKGAIMGQSQDNRVIIPIKQFLKYYSSFWNESLKITVKAINKTLMFEAYDEAIGIMRSIRNVKPWEENNFEIETNESVGEQFASFTQYINIFGMIVGFISLIAAGVGIMNIMLVTVKERTREIGVRKAMGAKRRWILYQFIIEAVTLCILGGLIGIGFGLLASAYFGNAMGLNLTIPTNLIIISLLICTFIGSVFGAYPAWKASKLDPIDALRYE